MTDRWRVQCWYKPYGVSDDMFTDLGKLHTFVSERLETCVRIQIDKQTPKEKKP